MAAGCDGWSDIELFGKQRIESLKQYRPLTHGVASDDTLRRFFRAVDPVQFQQLFRQWISQWLRPDDTETMAIDGKYLQGSRDSAQSDLLCAGIKGQSRS